MRSKNKKRKPPRWKSKLLLPDLDNAKAAVLASHHSPESQRSYRHAIDEFVGWYCSEPRLSFNKTVVTRYRIHFEDRRLAAGTTNVRLAAVRRLADEAADAGLLSPELAAGIRRVKGSKRLGIRLGDWLTAEQASSLWQLPNTGTLKSKRARFQLMACDHFPVAAFSARNPASPLLHHASGKILAAATRWTQMRRPVAPLLHGSAAAELSKGFVFFSFPHLITPASRALGAFL